MKGLATSAVAGADGLVRSSRAALIQFLKSHDPQTEPGVLVEFLQVLSTALSNDIQDDRYAIPIIEIMAFLLDGYQSYIFADQDESNPIFRRVFVLVQKAHFKTANIARLEAAIRVYAALSRIDSLRGDILKKLTSMLLHPFPRVCFIL